MTVALPNVQGIGWQGVPSHLVEQRATGFGKAIAQRRPPDDNTVRMPGPGLLVERKPLEELGPHFKQRVFTRKVRKIGNEKKHFEVKVVDPRNSSFGKRARTTVPMQPPRPSAHTCPNTPDSSRKTTSHP